MDRFDVHIVCVHYQMLHNFNRCNEESAGSAFACSVRVYSVYSHEGKEPTPSQPGRPAPARLADCPGRVDSIDSIWALVFGIHAARGDGWHSMVGPGGATYRR